MYTLKEIAKKKFENIDRFSFYDEWVPGAIQGKSCLRVYTLPSLSSNKNKNL